MTELDLEAVLSFDPDLIIAVYSSINEAEYAQLSQIAPTLAQSGDYKDYGTPWQEMTVTIGAADGAEATVSGVERAFETARAEHPEFESKSIVVLLTNPKGGFWAYL